MFLSAASVLVVAQPISEVPEGLMNYPVFVISTSSLVCDDIYFLIKLYVSGAPDSLTAGHSDTCDWAKFYKGLLTHNINTLKNLIFFIVFILVSDYDELYSFFNK
jgi:hypothetical protein